MTICFQYGKPFETSGSLKRGSGMQVRNYDCISSHASCPSAIFKKPTLGMSQALWKIMYFYPLEEHYKSFANSSEPENSTHTFLSSPTAKWLYHDLIECSNVSKLVALWNWKWQDHVVLKMRCWNHWYSITWMSQIMWCTCFTMHFQTAFCCMLADKVGRYHCQPCFEISNFELQ